MTQFLQLCLQLLDVSKPPKIAHPGDQPFHIGIFHIPSHSRGHREDMKSWTLRGIPGPRLGWSPCQDLARDKPDTGLSG
jgi:hypothetical protein